PMTTPLKQMKAFFPKLRHLIAGLLLLAGVATAEDDGSGFRISASPIPDGVALVVTSTYDTEFTTTLTCTLENARSSVPFPLPMYSAGRQSFQLLTIKQANPALAWKYSYKFNCKVGARRKETTNSYPYALPFPKSLHLPVSQGYFGKFSHTKGSQDDYA